MPVFFDILPGEVLLIFGGGAMLVLVFIVISYFRNRGSK